MTTIFWQPGEMRVYADSNHVDGSDKFESLTKVRALPKALPFVSKDFKINDVVYGYVITGHVKAAERFIASLVTTGDVDMLAAIYELMTNLHMVNADNYFEVIFIGAKSNYRFAPTVEAKEVVAVYSHDSNFAVGSGIEPLKDLAIQYPKANPVRLMYAVYARDPNSTGLIDVWELRKRKGEMIFQRVGICRGIEGRNHAELIADMYAPYPLDWILNPRAPKRPAPALDTPKPFKKTKKRLPVINQ